MLRILFTFSGPPSKAQVIQVFLRGAFKILGGSILCGKGSIFTQSRHSMLISLPPVTLTARRKELPFLRMPLGSSEELTLIENDFIRSEGIVHFFSIAIVLNLSLPLLTSVKMFLFNTSNFQKIHYTKEMDLAKSGMWKSLMYNPPPRLTPKTVKQQ